MSRLFDGVDDSLLIENPPVTGYPLTMACWFWTTSLTAAQTLMQLADKDLGNHWHLLHLAADVAGDPVQYNASAGAGGAGSASTSAGPSVSTWNHACAVGSSATARAVFLNGGSKGTNATSKTPAGMDRFTVGRFMASVNAFPFTGRIADAAIWNVALSDAEVAALAKGINPKRIRPANLVFYAPLWGTGSPEPDYTAGQRHLTVTGATQAPGPPVGLGPSIGFWLPPAAPAGGAAHALEGQSDGSSTTTGALAVAHPLAGTSAGTGATAGAVVIAFALAGSSAGVGTATGDATVGWTLTGSSAGASTATGTAGVAWALDGTTAGVGVATGDLTASFPLSGQSDGTSTATGDLTEGHYLIGTSAGAGTATGAIAYEAALAGDSTGTGTATAGLQIGRPLAGTSAGQGTASGDLSRGVVLVGGSTGTGTAQGTIAVSFTLAGLSGGLGQAAGALTYAVTLAGTSTGQGGAVAELSTFAPEGDSEWMQGPINLDPVGLEPGISLTR